MAKLTIYCPKQAYLQQLLKRQGYGNHIVTFKQNDFFKEFKKKVFNFLDKLPRDKLIDECLNFYFRFLLRTDTMFISDHNYYFDLAEFFIKSNIFKYAPIYRPIRLKKKYVALVYMNDKFLTIDTFSSLIEMEDLFQIRIKASKRDYRIYLK